MRRTTCGGCDSDELVEFLTLGTSPVADILLPESDSPAATYPLDLSVCTQCWLVQLMDVLPSETLYNGEYAYYAGVSKDAYHKSLAAQLAERYLPRQGFVVEIASNDGGLLSFLRDAGHRVLGVDPATGPAAVAAGRGVDTVTEPFDRHVAEHIRAGYGRPHLIVANHVVAHVADLNGLFDGVAVLIADDGALSVEVQYVADLIAGNQIDNVYHQHRYFFSISSLSAVAARHGFQVSSVREVEPQGGSIHVVFTRPGRQPVLPQGESWLRHLTTYTGMQARSERIRERLNEIMTAEQSKGRSMAAYGASAKSTTLLNFTGVSRMLDYVVDTTPAKVGKYLPGTGLQILSPEQEPERADTYLLTVWNYLPKVIRQESAFLNAGGRLITPIPLPVLL